MPLGFNIADLIRASSHRPTPYMPGTFTGKGKAERDIERATEERERLRQHALGRGRLGLGFGQLGLQAQGQQLQQHRFDEEQRAALEAEKRKMREGAIRQWIKAYVSGDEAAKDAALQNAQRLGFKLERTGGGVPAPQKPAVSVEPEDVELTPSKPGEPQIEALPTTGAKPEAIEAFKAAQIQRQKSTPLPGAGLRLPPPSREQAGVRIYDPEGNLAWQDTNDNVRQWYEKRAASSFGGLVDKYKDDPEATAAVLSGYSHAIGLIGSGTGADDAIKEGIKLTNAELDRMGKLERTEIMANRPRGGGSGPKVEDFAYDSKMDAVTKLGQHGKINAIREQESILTDALQKAMRGDAIGDVQGIGLYIQSISGKAVTDREYRRLAESTGMDALVARWKGWFTGEGPISQTQMRMLRDSLAQTLERLRGVRRGLADQAHEWVMQDTRPMRGANREQEARNAARVFYEDWEGGRAGSSGAAPTAAAPSKPAPKRQPKSGGASGKSLRKALESLGL
jgi:hypothetical protein